MRDGFGVVRVRAGCFGVELLELGISEMSVNRGGTKVMLVSGSRVLCVNWVSLGEVRAIGVCGSRTWGEGMVVLIREVLCSRGMVVCMVWRALVIWVCGYINRRSGWRESGIISAGGV